jgi:hypothetical protein
MYTLKCFSACPHLILKLQWKKSGRLIPPRTSCYLLNYFHVSAFISHNRYSCIYLFLHLFFNFASLSVCFCAYFSIPTIFLLTSQTATSSYSNLQTFLTSFLKCGGCLKFMGNKIKQLEETVFVKDVTAGEKQPSLLVHNYLRLLKILGSCHSVSLYHLPYCEWTVL